MTPFPAGRRFTTEHGSLTLDARSWFDRAGWQQVQEWTHTADTAGEVFSGFDGADDLMLWVRNVAASAADTRNVRVRVRGSSAFMDGASDYYRMGETGEEQATASIQVQSEATAAARSGVAVLQGLRSARPMAFVLNRARVFFIETEQEIDALRLYPGTGVMQSGSAVLFAR